MRVLLGIVGAVLVLDALVALLMILAWTARGHVPDFMQLSFYGVASVIMVFLKIVGGVAGAIQLWRFRPSGRVIAGVVLAYNIFMTLFAGIRAGVFSATWWGTLALNAALLLVVALPAAGEACREPVRARGART